MGPKCAGELRSYERNGVTIDQCNDCRGIVLDRGELERLTDAESNHYQAPAPAVAPAAAYEQGYAQPRAGGHHRSDDKHDGWGGKRRRRGGFLGEVFD
ncbi:zf-TFIIB domain-containing protein [Acidiferrimicrobium sp. IK]|uniref:TFIIB-type zinc ribbon-containing protein n=1 Tax=Acidiferrimicrobium sp. IK TaxID=2871700 RepID=UPI0021CAF5C7|nr:zf-TFIIB domain-containing protein [Acidiferrimicrobium sp. IK]MCU4185781.1 zf-TFIIB domain-containing protein [Acidiferrimicrobium sp. IK]